MYKKKNKKWVRKSVKQPQSFTKLLCCVCARGVCVCVRVSLAQPPRNSIISKYYTDRHTRMRVLESEIKNKKQGKGGKKRGAQGSEGAVSSQWQAYYALG